MIYQWRQFFRQAERIALFVDLHQNNFFEDPGDVVIEVGIVDDIRNNQFVEFDITNSHFVVCRQLQLSCKSPYDTLHETVDGADGNIGIVM
ncbi:hypothetical protein SDC9_87914 [bioreactor metagenome]|uniref:Uncharacterized protein n=1 Tax=bioreactor metagenome TaxID=1076179 RepID=A0A644ZUL3_9ZZZZ